MSSAPHGSDPVHDAAPCLVTGARGFIGTALVRRLRAAGRPVRALARSRANIPGDPDVTVVDLTSDRIPAGTLDGIATVYHLAAKTHDLFASAAADADYWRVNLEGTQRLLESLDGRSIKRIVFVSSVKAQTEETTGEIDETQPADPTTAYGRSKLAAERLILSEARRRGFDGVCLRFPLVYGPGQRGNLLRMIAAIDRGRFPPPPGGNRRSMLHVENAVDALMLAGHHPAAAGQTYTVTDGAACSTRELYDLIRHGLGKRPVQWAVPSWVFRGLAAAGDSARTMLGRRVGFDSDALAKLLGSAWFSSDKIARELGYRPTRTLRDAMPELVAGYRAEVAKRA